MHLRVYLLLHIIILVAHHGLYRTLAIFLVHALSTLHHESLPVLKLVAVVVTYDVAHLRLLNVRRDAQQVVETLITLCRLRCLVLRQHLGKFRSQRVGIHHLTLGIAWMHAHTLDGYLR